MNIGPSDEWDLLGHKVGQGLEGAGRDEGFIY